MARMQQESRRSQRRQGGVTVITTGDGDGDSSNSGGGPAGSGGLGTLASMVALVGIGIGTYLLVNWVDGDDEPPPKPPPNGGRGGDDYRQELYDDLDTRGTTTLVEQKWDLAAEDFWALTGGITDSAALFDVYKDVYDRWRVLKLVKCPECGEAIICPIEGDCEAVLNHYVTVHGLPTTTSIYAMTDRDEAENLRMLLEELQAASILSGTQATILKLAALRQFYYLYIRGRLGAPSNTDQYYSWDQVATTYLVWTEAAVLMTDFQAGANTLYAHYQQIVGSATKPLVNPQDNTWVMDIQLASIGPYLDRVWVKRNWPACESDPGGCVMLLFDPGDKAGSNVDQLLLGDQVSIFVIADCTLRYAGEVHPLATGGNPWFEWGVDDPLYS